MRRLRSGCRLVPAPVGHGLQLLGYMPQCAPAWLHHLIGKINRGGGGGGRGRGQVISPLYGGGLLLGGSIITVNIHTV